MSFRNSSLLRSSFVKSMLAAGLLAAAAPQVRGGDPLVLSGDVRGDVRNSAGLAQMGAVVSLYNRYDELIRQAFSSENGAFIFAGLPPDTYSIRVNLASFVPVVQRNIAVAPGSERLLKVNLRGLYSTVELAPPSGAQGALMSDEWKWVLKTSSATRPVLRFAPVSSSGSASDGHHHLATAFSETSGVVRLSAGESGPVAGSGSQNVGTAFSVFTKVNGVSRVRLSGDFGYIASSGLPTAAFRTTYSRDMEDGETTPQISLTVHQIYFPGLGPSSSTSNAGNPGLVSPGGSGSESPALRTTSLSAFDKLQINDDVQLEYGGQVDSVTFLQRETRVSPFARATYNMGSAGLLRVAFSSGAPPEAILNGGGATLNGETAASELNSELNRELAAMSTLPAISRDGGQTRLQRSQNMEAGYQTVKGSRKYYAAIYSQVVTDAAFDMSGARVFPIRADLLPALDGSEYIFDVGSYRRTGVIAAMTQSIGEHSDFTLGAGHGGVLLSSPGENPGNTGNDVRAQLRSGQRPFVTARASTTIPHAGTHMVASYGSTPSPALVPAYFSLTGPVNEEQGLNFAVHQPLPRFICFHGRMEAIAELRNALAQGYLPVDAGGYRTVLTDSPRAFRGGLSFLF
jgi:hypothetical protein